MEERGGARDGPLSRSEAGARDPSQVDEPPTLIGRVRGWVSGELAQAQHREALFLMINTGAMALAGLAFWVVLTRFLGVAEAAVGNGYAIISLGTAVAVVAKGGLDTAITRHAPGASRKGALRLLGLAVLIGLAVTLLLTLLLPLGALAGIPLPALSLMGWGLVLAIAAGLIVIWLQDAYFIAEREARITLGRNLAASVAKILLPIGLLALALPQPVALSWALALVLGGLLGIGLTNVLPDREEGSVDRRGFLVTTLRNVASSAAEFLPGLLLVPLVLAVEGPEAAAYFGIAWTVAHVLFQVSAAISRSALVSFVREPEVSHPKAVRRGVLQHLVIVVPGAVGAAVLAPYVLGIFGASYAAVGGPVLVVLCASIVVVSPAFLYLALLRAREQVVPLIALPLLTIAALFTLAPLLQVEYGLPGVAAAWCLANTPFGLWGAWRLYHEAKEPRQDASSTLDRRPHPG